MAEENGSIEEVKDIEKGSDGVVRRWVMELDKASQTEKQWRKDGKKALATYRLEEYNNEDFAKRKETFNILWSNTETVRPALYNSVPRPDIRRRYKDKDPLGKAVAEVCERSLTYTIDTQDLDTYMIAAVNDMLLPGRACTRVRYNPSFAEMEGAEADTETGEIPEELTHEEIGFEQVQWDDFRRGPGKCWDEIPWIAFKHKLTKDEIGEKFPEFKDVVQYDATVYDEKTTGNDDDVDKEIFKRCLVWEIWEKKTKKVHFIAPSYKDKALDSKADPLNLAQFWPIPRPLYAIENATTLTPSTKYSMYETLAVELENVTNRIKKILAGLRLRGIYDARIAEIEKLFDSYDNTFIPTENVAALLEAGGLDKAIWTLPMDMYAEVLIQLKDYRTGLIHSIYEITGISDVLRGDSDPGETLGAQQIKANFGSQRLKREQREVQRYARDLIKITCEVITENFSIDTLRLMTGLNFPTNEMKQQAQQQLQMQAQQAQMQMQQAAVIAQQQGQQPPPPQPPPQPDPQILEMLEQPSWEEIQEVMSNDLMRDYRVDIETDSTIEAEQQEDQKNITDLLAGITNFMASVSEPIMSGIMTVDTAKTMLMAAVRRFKLGREVEDALEDIEAPQQNQGVPQEQVDEQMQQVQQQAEQMVQKATQEAQGKAQEAEQRSGQQAQDAISQAKRAEQESGAKAQEVEQKCKELITDIQKKATNDLAAEKARNQIVEKTQSLDFKQAIFKLEQQLVDAKNSYTDTLATLKTSVVDCQHNAKAESVAEKGKAAEGKKVADGEKKNDGVMASVLSKITDLIESSTKDREDSTGKVVEELGKPRTVVRDDDNNITGIE